MARGSGIKVVTLSGMQFLFLTCDEIDACLFMLPWDQYRASAPASGRYNGRVLGPQI